MKFEPEYEQMKEHEDDDCAGCVDQKYVEYMKGQIKSLRRDKYIILALWIGTVLAGLLFKCFK